MRRSAHRKAPGPTRPRSGRDLDQRPTSLAREALKIPEASLTSTLESCRLLYADCGRQTFTVSQTPRKLGMAAIAEGYKSRIAREGLATFGLMTHAFNNDASSKPCCIQSWDEGCTLWWPSPPLQPTPGCIAWRQTGLDFGMHCRRNL